MPEGEKQTGQGTGRGKGAAGGQERVQEGLEGERVPFEKVFLNTRVFFSTII